MIRSYLESQFLRDKLKLTSGAGLSFAQIRAATIPIWVVDSNHRIVFSPELGNATIKTVNEGVSKYKIGTDNDESIDYVEIQLSYSVGQPLKVNQNIPALESKVFIPSFPDPTSDRYKFDLPDADGKNLVFLGNDT